MAAPGHRLARARARAEAGRVVLELAAGQGDVGFALRLCWVRADGWSRVTSARRCSRSHVAEGRSSASTRRVPGLDAEELDLEDDSVDGVLCRWGYMLMPDPAARSARRGGCYAPAGGSRSRSGRAGPQPLDLGRRPDPRRARTHAASGAGRTGHVRAWRRGAAAPLVEDAGFANVRIEDVPVRHAYRERRRVRPPLERNGWHFSRAWSAAPRGGTRGDKDELRDAFEPFAADSGYELPGSHSASSRAEPQAVSRYDT